MGGVKMALMGGWGLKAGSDEVLDGLLLLLCWAVVATGNAWLSCCFWASSSCKATSVNSQRQLQTSESALRLHPLTCFLKLSLSLSREGGWRLDFWASRALAMWALESRRPVSGTGINHSGPYRHRHSPFLNLIILSQHQKLYSIYKNIFLATIVHTKSHRCIKHSAWMNLAAYLCPRWCSSFLARSSPAVLSEINSVRQWPNRNVRLSRVHPCRMERAPLTWVCSLSTVSL